MHVALASASAAHPHSGRSAIHRLSALTKLIALVIFALLVVATPREWFPAFACFAMTLVVAIAVARVAPTALARRSVMGIPVLVCAALMPALSAGERVDVFGVALSVPGLWAAWSLMVKASFTFVAALVFTATTPPEHTVQAFQRLRVPRTLTSIMAFMIRYSDLVVDEANRLSIARRARGFEARGPAAWPALSGGVSVLFVRAHARGERVHLAMLARGFRDGGGASHGDERL